MVRFGWFKLVFILLVILGGSCGKALPHFEGMDLNTWRQDKDGCSGVRLTMEQELRLQADKLLALSERQVVDVLGKPDQNELYKRNQKFYYYQIEPGTVCDSTRLSTKRLAIRFNAMGLAKEVSME